MKTTLFLALLLFAQSATTKKYDPKRNADSDVKNAIAEARKTGKRVLLEVGGEWCSWCHSWTNTLKIILNSNNSAIGTSFS